MLFVVVAFTTSVNGAPARTPAPIVALLSDAINKSLADPVILKRLQDAGVDPTPDGTPEKLAEFQARDYFWEKVKDNVLTELKN